MSIQPGDTVFLKSGSPAMTAARIRGADVDCAWSHAGTLHRQTFPLAALTRARPATLQTDREYGNWDDLTVEKIDSAT